MAETMQGRTSGRNYANNRDDIRVTVPTETRRAFLTTEFWAMVAGIAAVLIVAYADSNDSLTAYRAWLLVTIIASSYIVSRGLSKAGSSGVVRRSPDYFNG